MRRKRGRRSLREQLEASHAGQSYYAISFGRQPPPKPKLLLELEARAAARKPRAKPGANGRPLERDVLRAVIKALRSDPRVASVERNQSGVFQDGEHYIRVGSKGKLDLTVYLRDGRYMEVEIKRANVESLLSAEQRERLRSIRASGGLAGWCWDAQSALALLP